MMWYDVIWLDKIRFDLIKFGVKSKISYFSFDDRTFNSWYSWARLYIKCFVSQWVKHLSVTVRIFRPVPVSTRMLCPCLSISLILFFFKAVWNMISFINNIKHANFTIHNLGAQLQFDSCFLFLKCFQVLV